MSVREPLPHYLAEWQQKIEEVARRYGLDFFPINYEVLDYKTMNEVAAYGGFPTRYPHWRFGMDYEGLSKGYEYGLQKIYEMVINTDPAYAYLLEGNSMVDQKTVMAHVCGHVDFFKNNYFFSKTNRRMIDGMANHATRVRRHIERQGIEKVETFIDTCLSLDNLIDPMSQYIVRRAPPPREGDEPPEEAEVPKLRSKQYMDKYINPPEFLDKQREKLKAEKERAKKFPEQAERDVLLFLIEHAPLERWERDILEIIRDEAYYFAPQAATKIMNEGWACLAAESRVYTEAGLITMRELVEGGAGVVHDGEQAQRVYDRNVIRDHETVRVRTRRGIEVCGSNNHRVMLPDGSWRRLDALAVGDCIRIAGGGDLWPQHEVELDWMPPTRVGLADVAERAGVSLWTVLRHRAGRPVRAAAAVAEALQAYEAPANEVLPQALGNRAPVHLPVRVDARLGALLGYLVGDGHISRVKRHFGLTTGDEPQAARFHALAGELFGLSATLRKDGGRWRVLVHSETASDFLQQALGLTSGPSAREKRVPEAVLRSPEPVVREFLRAYFDCDGHAGKQGVILSTTSDALAADVQLLLMNYGILSRRRKLAGCWHVHVAGASAARFAERVGFGLARKQAALETYVRERRWFKAETWDDEVVSLERGRADVYDISVTETHRYAAAGVINHNSYWHSKLLTMHVLDASEIIDYADHASGILATSEGQLNPYKLGIELFRDIEERWDRGAFGKEWEECDDLAARKNWDRRLGLGRKKIFEVRKLYSDVTFIDEFFTEDFCRQHKFFSFGFNDRSGNWEIESREFKKVKNKLLFQLTNRGQPFIFVEDGNFENRSELLIKHKHEGIDLKLDYARDTLGNLARVWKRPVNLLTRMDGKGKVLRFDGKDHSERAADYK